MIRPLETDGQYMYLYLSVLRCCLPGLERGRVGVHVDPGAHSPPPGQGGGGTRTPGHAQTRSRQPEPKIQNI